MQIEQNKEEADKTNKPQTADKPQKTQMGHGKQRQSGRGINSR